MSVLGRAIAFVGVSDLDAAYEFYAGTLGLALRDERPFALVADTAGGMLRITLVPDVVVAGYTVAGFEVDDATATARALAGSGVVFSRYDGLAQDDDGIWTAPGGSRIGWFRDPDGNTLSISQFVR